jgi:hypothetical protein
LSSHFSTQLRIAVVISREHHRRRKVFGFGVGNQFNAGEFLMMKTPNATIQAPEKVQARKKMLKAEG